MDFPFHHPFRAGPLQVRRRCAVGSGSAGSGVLIALDRHGPLLCARLCGGWLLLLHSKRLCGGGGLLRPWGCRRAVMWPCGMLRSGGLCPGWGSMFARCSIVMISFLDGGRSRRMLTLLLPPRLLLWREGLCVGGGSPGVADSRMCSGVLFLWERGALEDGSATVGTIFFV